MREMFRILKTKVTKDGDFHIVKGDEDLLNGFSTQNQVLELALKEFEKKLPTILNGKIKNGIVKRFNHKFVWEFENDKLQ